MYRALPKNSFGNLDHAAARYALHRSFVKAHGWTLSGLEPTHHVTKSNSSATEGLQEWVPEYLLTVIEELLGTHGISLYELAVLGATFEDLAHKEAHTRLREVFDHLKLPADSVLDDEKAEDVLGTYMIMYTSAHGHSVKTAEDVDKLQLALEAETKKWLEDVMDNMTNLPGTDGEPLNVDDLDYQKMTLVVEEVGEQYASFNDQECSALKNVLTEIEDPYKLGRVRLSDFYEKGMNQGYWNLDEKVDYLRALGALDESNPNRPRVIVPNYISSQANCISSSNFYTICCRNECEDKMSQLEQAIGAPVADAKQIELLIVGLNASSDPAVASTGLPSELQRRLQDVADYHDGQVPLHGRLFAQWMHHVFPRECPYPSEAAENAQTPSEWLRDFGEESTRASKEEMMSYVKKPAPVSENKLKARVLQRSEPATIRVAAAVPGDECDDDKLTQLPWSPAERLIVQPKHQQSVDGFAAFFVISEQAAYYLLSAFLIAAGVFAVVSARDAMLARPSLANKLEAYKRSKLEEERSLEQCAHADRVRRRHKIEQAAQMEDLQTEV
jgi:hypothetical protein